MASVKKNTTARKKDVRSSKGSSKSLPVVNMRVYNFPRHIRVFVPTLPKSLEDNHAIDEGNVVSEVGFGKVVSIPAVGTPFLAYPLRERKPPRHLPTFVRGGLDLGDAFSAMVPRHFPVPAVGERVTINPILTHQQSGLMTSTNRYHFVRADVKWVVAVPAPLGTALILRGFAPEFDESTVTRGVRWKPAAQNAIAFSMDWSNDIAFLETGEPRQGSSGLSLCIETVEDNSTESVNTPLIMTVWCCVHNVKLTGLRNPTMADQNIPVLNFTPVAS
ncbi:MAG: hypothetical protein [Apis nora virus 2]|nr:MAG: hypothetical protein [Apis nora virus 2]